MLTYKESGVDIDAGNELVKRLKKICPNIGGFSGRYPLGDDFLVAGADGVGTKLRLAIDLQKYDNIGQDLVAMCVNDVITCGASPLFFLDYFATGKLDVDVAEKVLNGIHKSCKESGCVLLGGETAEMPSFYKNGDFDLSGFCVAKVPQKDYIDGSKIQAGSVLVGLPSSGVHSNGFSLIRAALQKAKIGLDHYVGDFGRTVGEELLEPTLLYERIVRWACKRATILGMAHITGGGLLENTQRVLPKGLSIRIHTNSWTIPPVFAWLQNLAGIAGEEMVRSFNMGIGMILICSPEDGETLSSLYPIVGEVREGEHS